VAETFEDKIVQPDERAELPAELASDMALWREGWIGMPVAYIRFHEKLAHKEFSRIREKYGLISDTQPFLVGEGWFDGMRVVEARCERSDGKPLTLRWHPGSQRFFLWKPNGGSSVFQESDICPDAEEAKSRHAFPWAWKNEVTF